MKSQKRVGPALKSKYPTEVILTVEEATLLADCDPDAVSKLSTFLVHMGVKKKDVSND